MTAVALAKTERSRPRRRFLWLIIGAAVGGLLWFTLLYLWCVGIADLVFGATTEALDKRGSCGEWKQTQIAGKLNSTVLRWRDCEVDFSFHTARFLHIEYEDFGISNENIQVDIRWWPATAMFAIIVVAVPVLLLLLGELWRTLVRGSKTGEVA